MVFKYHLGSFYTEIGKPFQLKYHIYKSLNCFSSDWTNWYWYSDERVYVGKRVCALVYVIRVPYAIYSVKLFFVYGDKSMFSDGTLHANDLLNHKNWKHGKRAWAMNGSVCYWKSILEHKKLHFTRIKTSIYRNSVTKLIESVRVLNNLGHRSIRTKITSFLYSKLYSYVKLKRYLLVYIYIDLSSSSQLKENQG